MIDVLVDARPVRARTTGVSRIITALVNLIKTDERFRFHVVGSSRCSEHWPDPSGISFIDAGQRSGPTAGRRLMFEQLRLRRIISRLRPDVYWATWDYGVPLACTCPTVLTVHDLIPLRDAGRRWSNIAYRINLRLALSGSTKIVADSEATLDDLINLCHVQRDRITVIPPGVGEEFHPQRCATDPNFGTGPFALYVGGYAPRKNFHILLLAFERLLNEGSLGVLTLVATGSEERLDAESRSVLARLKTRGIVRFTGNVPNDVLPGLYRQASVFVFPSLAEGFGFPPLEAMACGVPVICGRADSLAEVVGEAGHFVNVRDPGEIAAAMVKILGDVSYATRLKEAGLAQAAKFRWRRSAASMSEVLLTAARRPYQQAAD